jgi:hypothetical protein
LIPWLAGIDPETGGARRRIAHPSEIPAQSRSLIQCLVEQRLLVADRDSIEIAHESILRQWTLFSAWLAEDAEQLMLLDGVERAAREWARNGRRPALLVHQAERLSASEKLLALADFRRRLGEAGEAYLAACHDREAAARTKDRRHRRELVIAFIAFAIGIVYAVLKQTGLLGHLPF